MSTNKIFILLIGHRFESHDTGKNLIELMLKYFSPFTCPLRTPTVIRNKLKINSLKMMTEWIRKVGDTEPITSSRNSFTGAVACGVQISRSLITRVTTGDTRVHYRDPKTSYIFYSDDTISMEHYIFNSHFL